MDASPGCLFSIFIRGVVELINAVNQAASRQA
jgi:hypothetical protein